MLVIKKKQMQAFDKERHAQLVRTIMQHCRENWSRQSKEINDKELKKYIEKQLQIASQFEIKHPQEQIHYVNQSFVWGENFHLDRNLEWIQEILNDKNLRGSAKIYQLRTKTRVKLIKIKVAKQS